MEKVTIERGQTYSGLILNQIQDNVDNAKQDKLISGTNIKTINSQSLLGEGDIDVSPVWGNIDGSIEQQEDLNEKLNHMENKIEKLQKNLEFEPVLNWYVGDNETVTTPIEDDLTLFYIWVNTHIHNREIAMLTYFSGVGTYHVDRIITGSQNTEFSLDGGTNILTITGASGCRGQLYKVSVKTKS